MKDIFKALNNREEEWAETVNKWAQKKWRDTTPNFLESTEGWSLQDDNLLHNGCVVYALPGPLYNWAVEVYNQFIDDSEGNDCLGVKDKGNGTVKPKRKTISRKFKKHVFLWIQMKSRLCRRY